MNRFRFVIAALLWVALPTQPFAQDTKTIRIATEGAFPPWNAVDASGTVIGYDVDVGKEVCKRAQLACEFVTQAWDGIIPGLTVGKYDAIMAGMSITDKRLEVIGFSTPYALTSNYFVFSASAELPAMNTSDTIDLSSGQKRDEDLIEGLRKNVKNKIIGVQGSTNAEAFVRDYFGNDVEVRIYDKQDSLNLDLVAGRIDGGLADYSVWKTFLETPAGNRAALYGPRISGGVFGPGVGIGLRKEDGELSKSFNTGIEAMKNDGTLRALSLKWFGADLISK